MGTFDDVLDGRGRLREVVQKGADVWFVDAKELSELDKIG